MIELLIFIGILILLFIGSIMHVLAHIRRYQLDKDFQLRSYDKLEAGDAYFRGTPKLSKKIGCFILEQEGKQILIEAHNMRGKQEHLAQKGIIESIKYLIDQQETITVRANIEYWNEEPKIIAKYYFTDDEPLKLFNYVLIWILPATLLIMILGASLILLSN